MRLYGDKYMSPRGSPRRDAGCQSPLGRHSMSSLWYTMCWLRRRSAHGGWLDDTRHTKRPGQDHVRQTRKDFFVVVAQIWLAAWLIGLGVMSYAGK